MEAPRQHLQRRTLAHLGARHGPRESFLSEKCKIAADGCRCTLIAVAENRGPTQFCVRRSRQTDLPAYASSRPAFEASFNAVPASSTWENGLTQMPKPLLESALRFYGTWKKSDKRPSIQRVSKLRSAAKLVWQAGRRRSEPKTPSAAYVCGTLS